MHGLLKRARARRMCVATDTMSFQAIQHGLKKETCAADVCGPSLDAVLQRPLEDSMSSMSLNLRGGSSAATVCHTLLTAEPLAATVRHTLLTAKPQPFAVWLRRTLMLKTRHPSYSAVGGPCRSLDEVPHTFLALVGLPKQASSARE